MMFTTGRLAQIVYFVYFEYIQEKHEGIEKQSIQMKLDHVEGDINYSTSF